MKVLPTLGAPLVAVAVLIISVTASQQLPNNEGPPEVRRLREHFRRVDAELTSRDVSHLSAQQRAARARNIEVLREYARAGIFPHNHDFPDQTLPFFRDEHGTLCAMAYLIARSGDVELVERVAHTNNNAFISELANDSALIDWLDRNGMTAAEAARVQPAYNQQDDPEDRAYERNTVILSVVQGGMIAWTIAADPKRQPLVPGIVAIGSGVFGFMMGAAGDYAGGKGTLPELNALVGGATAVAGIVYIVRSLNTLVRRPAQVPAESSQLDRVQPLLSVGMDGRTQAGLQVRF